MQATDVDERVAFVMYNAPCHRRAAQADKGNIMLRAIYWPTHHF